MITVTSETGVVDYEGVMEVFGNLIGEEINEMFADVFGDDLFPVEN